LSRPAGASSRGGSTATDRLTRMKKFLFLALLVGLGVVAAKRLRADA
jgi:hypothetical protein